MCAQAPKDAADFSAGLLGIGTLPQVRGQSQLLADIAIAEASFRTTPTAQTGPPKSASSRLLKIQEAVSSSVSSGIPSVAGKMIRLRR